jgi:hypothetical protein
MVGKKALLFVNKKKQKNFIHLHRAGEMAIGPMSAPPRHARESGHPRLSSNRPLPASFAAHIDIAPGPESKKFFGSFFQKRTAFFLLEQGAA